MERSFKDCRAGTHINKILHLGIIRNSDLILDMRNYY